MSLNNHPPQLFRYEQATYHAFSRLRDTLLASLSSLLNYANITPNMVSLFGVIQALLFALSIRYSYSLAAVFLLLAILSDLIDGPLARYQKTASDRGKLIDMLSDASTFTIITSGLIYAGLLNNTLGLTYIASMLISKILRVMYYARHLSTDWIFRAVAGFLPNLLVASTYVLIMLSFLTTKNLLFIPLIIFTTILTIDAVITYLYLLAYQKPRHS
jgi:phosphatidylglycerophosphate synthase